VKPRLREESKHLITEVWRIWKDVEPMFVPNESFLREVLSWEPKTCAINLALCEIVLLIALRSRLYDHVVVSAPFSLRTIYRELFFVRRAAGEEFKYFLLGCSSLGLVGRYFLLKLSKLVEEDVPDRVIDDFFTMLEEVGDFLISRCGMRTGSNPNKISRLT